MADMIPLIVLGVMAIISLVIIYSMKNSIEERYNRAHFIYSYAAFIPYAVIMIVIISLIMLR
jgi:cell division protein FtsW (lipid II flippase)